MKYQDFGQFLFNSSTFDSKELIQIISQAKNVSPTYSTTALFLRLISANELITAYEDACMIENAVIEEIFRRHNPEIQEKYDAIIRKFLNPKNFHSIENAVDEPSVKLAQVLADGVLDFEKFEKILDCYHKEEIPPVEKIFASWYNSSRLERFFAYLPALEVAKNFHDFLSESLKTTIIFSATNLQTNDSLFGASVRIKGAMPVIVGVIAEKGILHRLANSYDKFVSENLEEDFDAVAEMLNVFTGNFTVRIASKLGLEEELYPPRYGQFEKNIDLLLNVACDVGEFYLYVGDEEIF